MKVFLVILISYLFGSIPWGLVIGKVFYHKDIRKEGSGNIGGTNAGRVLGKPAAISVTLLDAFKAFISMWIASMIDPDAILLAGLACAIGHCFPVFAQFKGGKAVATAYGYFLGITVFITHSWFWNFFWPIILFFAILYFTRIVSISSISAVGIETITSLIVNRSNLQVFVCLLILWALITYRHKANLIRIKNGTESHIKWMGERHGNR
ncbi:MAG: glycerol-3-phosphate 1-O-acyltransferase PlsY [Lactimicrobium sp.]|uniref:glycerol-3-phosphate 1-O-acyltransferase PlsY n=1 Tax=Lactimicrobium sp. TaxID=2563780 RepID=UPI002F34F935